MTDHVSQAKRSMIMRSVRAKHSSPELAVRKIIFALGYRYRLHGANLPGKPDIVFPGKKKVIFIHGCFWHAHGCPKGKPPKSNLSFWLPKFEKNKTRDTENVNSIISLGWKPLVIWQCEIKNKDVLIEKIRVFLDN
jgi:DNA mismatch endonuclease (patch repair protein)